MSKIGDNKVIVFIGKRNSGKSCLVLDYLSHNLDLPIGMVISPTDEFNQTFYGKVPDMFIHSEITPELLQAFLTRQELQAKKAKKDPSIDPRAFLILDDCMADAQSWVNDRTIKFLFMNGRHVNTTLIITLQDPVGIPPRLRTNIDYVFVCKDTNKQNRKKMYDMYAGMFANYQLFEDTMLQCCDNYACLALFKNSQSYKLEEQVFWYKANMDRIKNFKICHPNYWKFNEEFKKKKQQAELDKEKDDLMRAQPRRNGVYTIVRKLDQNVDNIN
jgi:hypothetical protein